MLLFSFIHGYGQNLSETVEYINDLLKLHTYNLDFPEIKTSGHAYDCITIDEHGKIEVRRYIEDESTGKILTKGQTGYAYLKALEMGTIENHGGGNIATEFRLKLSCKSQGNCATYQFNSEGSSLRSYLSFQVDNDDVRERLKNALLHLLELARNIKEFYEKDPFEID
jgi:hypothetical protein